MATCGIASGARPVLTALSDAVQEQNLSEKISVTQTGCIGLCQYEPIVEVMEPGKEKVTYVKMTPEKALEVLRLHLLGGQVVTKYTLSAAQNNNCLLYTSSFRRTERMNLFLFKWQPPLSYKPLFFAA